MDVVVVAVVPGAEVADVFRARGARTLNAGRHMNPSVGELLEAIEAGPAAEVVLLANDPHVVPAARQVPGLTEKTVGIVPSRGICEGLAAMAVAGSAPSFEATVEAMTAAASAVRSTRIDRAIRDSSWAGGAIRQGDWIAIEASHGIVAADADVRRLLEHAAGILTDGARALTIVRGDGSDDETMEWLSAWARARGLAVETLDAGTSVPPFVLGAS